ncbi:MAG TPA: PhaM family polyhydroxyalkanoate granule multifunctional regulatory protein [Paraburkholderia sp.]|jgi:hypothetical protein|nr:PhaM family polyhydroxyalkanoate granule multifunctional regulatory protein [Paraburkholderia sp.]
MTDTPGAAPPFPGFPGFPPAEMLDRMWGMMRLTPFGSAFPGAEPGVAQGFGPSLSMMSDLMAPLTNVEELDKRITDMRAVEQWLKLNLNMLQSAIQALEVQRATLATLRAFGTFAQAQMTPPPSHADAPAAPKPAPGAQQAAEPPADDTRAAAAGAAPGAEAPPAQTPPFDASAWWNLLQSQFNQLAQFAMAQPAAAAEGIAKAAAAAGGDKPAASGGKQAGASKRPPGRAAPRAAKKTPPKAE